MHSVCLCEYDLQSASIAGCLTKGIWWQYAEEEDFKILKAPSHSNGANVVLRQMARDSGNRALKQRLRTLKQDYRASKSAAGAVSACWSCHKATSELAPGQDLKVCSKCKTIERMILYCSR